MAAETSERSNKRLRTAECWGLLESVTLGRLAVTGLDGAPDIFPLNYTVHDGSLYVRSAHGAKVLDIATRPMAALEIDGEDETSHWSVVVRGPATLVGHDAEIRDSGVLRLRSVNPASKPHVIRLTPTTVTGRRFRKDAQAEGPDSTATNGSLDTEDTTGTSAAADDRPRRTRAERPKPIPSFAPDPDDAPDA